MQPEQPEAEKNRKIEWLPRHWPIQGRQLGRSLAALELPLEPGTIGGNIELGLRAATVEPIPSRLQGPYPSRARTAVSRVQLLSCNLQESDSINRKLDGAKVGFFRIL